MVTFRAVLSDLQTDAIDHHRALHDKHGPAGKRELQPEDGAEPGERRLVPASMALGARHLPGHTGRWGSVRLWPPPTCGLSLSLARPHLSAARNGGSKTHEWDPEQSQGRAPGDSGCQDRRAWD